jgi:hypothetical protein
MAEIAEFEWTIQSLPVQLADMESRLSCPGNRPLAECPGIPVEAGGRHGDTVKFTVRQVDTQLCYSVLVLKTTPNKNWLGEWLMTFQKHLGK